MKKNSNTFFEKVHKVVLKIPKGSVTNYGAIADYLGTGLSARMVGWAMNAAHASTSKIPAHRVVNRNGMLTGKHHFSTPSLMQDLLEAEGLEIVDDEIQNFEKHFWDPSTELNSKSSSKKKISSLPKKKKGHRLR